MANTSNGVYRDINSARPVQKAAAVTPSDVTVLPVTRGLYVGTTGNLNVVMAEDGATVLFSNVPVGFVPLQVTQVLSTSTTASTIVALW